MRVRNIQLGDDDLPETVDVRLSRGELLYLAKLTGGYSPVSAEEVAPGIGSLANEETYSVLVGDVINRYWDGGVEEALRETR